MFLRHSCSPNFQSCSNNSIRTQQHVFFVLKIKLKGSHIFSSRASLSIRSLCSSLALQNRSFQNLFVLPQSKATHFLNNHYLSHSTPKCCYVSTFGFSITSCISLDFDCIQSVIYSLGFWSCSVTKQTYRCKMIEQRTLQTPDQFSSFPYMRKKFAIKFCKH